jgi:mRNA interferase RelE/StbE
MAYEIVFTKSAVKDLERLPVQINRKLIEKIEGLAQDPRPPKSKKLIGSVNSWRIRLGDYRVLYSIFDHIL